MGYIYLKCESMEVPPVAFTGVVEVVLCHKHLGTSFIKGTLSKPQRPSFPFLVEEKTKGLQKWLF